MHSKGSYHNNPTNEVLRPLLTSAIFSDKCLAAAPTECDVCSARFSPLPQWHAPGNMWVAPCSYVRNLVSPKAFPTLVNKAVQEARQVYHWAEPGTQREPLVGQGRFANEHWVHTYPTVKPCDLYTIPWTWCSSVSKTQV
jgi:hypothetical protein